MSRDQLDVARRLWTYVRPYRLKLAATFAFTVAATPLALLVPLPLKIAIDSILGNRPLPGPLAAVLAWLGVAPTTGASLALISALLITLTLLLYLQGLLAWTSQTWLGEMMVLDLRAALLRHAQRLSLSYHDQAGTTDSVYRIQYDAQSLQYVIVTGLIPLAAAALTLSGMIAVTAFIDPQLAIIALAVCPVLYWIAVRFGKQLRRRWFEVKDLDSSAMSVVEEVLSAVRIVKAFGREEHEQKRFLARSGDRLSGQLDLAKIQGRMDLAVGVTMAAGTALVLSIGVLHVKAGLITTGQLLIVMAYLSQIYEPLKTMSKKIADLQAGLVSAERALCLLDELPEVPEHPNPVPLTHARGEFEFQNAGFAYETARPILRDLSFRVAAGARVGIQGRTGAGKSTLISLLTRFYDVTAGSILLDGVDIREYKIADLRNQFSIVLQDTILFSTTIAENIAYGRPDATETEIIEAARLANAHDFISSLPDGYQTQVGERGMRLSGGERQRISIARAFLKDAPILLLDEPTSAVDSATEAAIVDAMERLMQGRTVFMIAHRLNTLRSCDVRLVLSENQARIATAADLANA
jgi:ATP-binding cassette subfamily B protein